MAAADSCHCLKAVHNRHTQIQQDGVICAVRSIEICLQCLASIFHRIHLLAVGPYQLCCYLTVKIIVLCQLKPQAAAPRPHPHNLLSPDTGLYGLWNKTIHPCLKSFPAILLKGIGCQGYNRDGRCLGMDALPYPAGRIQSSQNRHL